MPHKYFVTLDSEQTAFTRRGLDTQNGKNAQTCAHHRAPTLVGMWSHRPTTEHTASRRECKTASRRECTKGRLLFQETTMAGAWGHVLDSNWDHQ